MAKDKMLGDSLLGSLGGDATGGLTADQSALKAVVGTSTSSTTSVDTGTSSTLQAAAGAAIESLTAPAPAIGGALVQGLISVELGQAANYALLDLGGGGTFSDGKSTITGNVALADNTTWAQAGQSAINGNVSHGSPYTVTGSGTSVSGTIKLDESGVTQAAADAVTASAFFKGLAANLSQSSFGGAAGVLTTTTVNGSVGYNVVNLTGLTLSGGAVLTLNGVAGTEFVINVDGPINLSNGSIVETGGISAADVIINEVNSSASVSLSGTSKMILNGILLAPNNAILDDATVNGAIIGGKGQTITTQSGVVLTYADKPNPVCFMEGTQVLMASGELRSVEAIAAGDLVRTAEGGVSPVRWLGLQTVQSKLSDPVRVLPIRIRQGALGENLPIRDLLLSPCHAIALDGVLVQAGALVNGETIVREHDVPDTFVYYHVELETHALLLAEGVPAETFIDNVERMAFDNWNEHLALPPAQMAELPMARVQSARQLPASIRSKLMARTSAGFEPAL